MDTTTNIPLWKQTHRILTDAGVCGNPDFCLIPLDDQHPKTVLGDCRSRYCALTREQARLVLRDPAVAAPLVIAKNRGKAEPLPEPNAEPQPHGITVWYTEAE